MCNCGHEEEWRERAVEEKYVSVVEVFNTCSKLKVTRSKNHNKTHGHDMEREVHQGASESSRWKTEIKRTSNQQSEKNKYTQHKEKQR